MLRLSFRWTRTLTKTLSIIDWLLVITDLPGLEGHIAGLIGSLQDYQQLKPLPADYILYVVWRLTFSQFMTKSYILVIYAIINSQKKGNLKTHIISWENQILSILVINVNTKQQHRIVWGHISSLLIKNQLFLQ